MIMMTATAGRTLQCDQIALLTFLLPEIHLRLGLLDVGSLLADAAPRLPCWRRTWQASAWLRDASAADHEPHCPSEPIACMQACTIAGRIPSPISI